MSEVEVSPNTQDAQSARKEIEDFLQQINTDNFAKAERSFKDMVGGRLGDMLDQQKAKIAGQMFNTAEVEIPDEQEEIEPEEVDLTPEDFDDEEDFEDDEETA